MNEERRRVWPAIAFGVAAATCMAACGARSTAPSSSATNASVAAGPPPVYPAAAQPAGYPASQPGNAGQAAYPPPQAPGYAVSQPGYAPQLASPAAAQSANAPTSQGVSAAAPPGPAPSASQTLSGPLAPFDPNSLQSILQGIQGALQGTLIAPAALPADLTEAGLKAQALRVAPGMQPEGDQLKQNLAEGQHAVMMLTMQAGKCYAIVSFSPMGGVRDLELNLLAPPLYITLAGQSMARNNMPTIGAIGSSPSAMCPVIAFPLQYKLDVFARLGSGQVAVQLYSKNKGS
jgi:hypothetical protein